jgi:catalase
MTLAAGRQLERKIRGSFMDATTVRGIRAKKVAIAIADGMKAESTARVRSALVREGAVPLLLGIRADVVRSADGQEFLPDATLKDSSSTPFDALVLPDGDEAVDYLVKDGHVIDLLHDQYRLCNTILAVGASSKLLEKCGIPKEFPDGQPDRGILVAAGSADIAPLLIAAIAEHRHRGRGQGCASP